MAIARVFYLNTVPCDDSGEPIDYLRQPWYPTDRVGFCAECGQARGLTGVIPAQSPARPG
jgi:hypothetical protein